MTPDLPIPEAAREAIAEEMFVHRSMPNPRDPFITHCGCGETFGTAVERQKHAADAVLAAALPHLRSLQVETQVEYGRAIGRREAAEEIAAKSLRRAQLAERVPEPMRSGVREGMVVTWLAAQKLALEVAEPTSEPRTDLPVGPSHPKDSQTAREAL